MQPDIEKLNNSEYQVFYHGLFHYICLSLDGLTWEVMRRGKVLTSCHSLEEAVAYAVGIKEIA